MRGADASRGHHQVRWRDAPRGQDGRARRRPPDIEEFVETKAREEDKIRALRDAGFDMDLGGGHHLRAVPERQQLRARQ
jgi:ribonucleoside-diphosphate reductase alpha chain